MLLVANAVDMSFQDMDGEIVAINFASGAYFSMRGTAAEIWRDIVAGLDTEAIKAGYRETADAAPAIEQFFAELEAAKLVVRGDGDGMIPPQVAPRRYEAPRLEQFGDMAELIVLDPVHDVSEAGWPHKAP